MKTPIPRMITLAFALTSGLTPIVQAQTAVTAPVTPPAQDDVYTLTPFVVNTDKDTGYVAVDSLAGGRTNTPIKLTPAAMSSLTRTFIDDVGVQNVRDALKWSPNVIPSDYVAGKQLANPFNAWDYNFRGAGQSLQGGAGPTRNYFTFYSVADTYNIERIEFDRGPNSILFGVGTVGGVLSTYTKIPRTDRDFYNVTTTVDSNSSFRLELDFNRRLNDKLAIRLNGLLDRNRGWRENDKNDTNAVDLAFLFTPTKSTQIRLELEKSESENTLISSLMNDGISKWDGTTVANTWGQAVSGGGTRVSQSAGWWANPYNVWIPGLSSKGIMNWNGGTISAGIDPDGIPFAPRAGWYGTFVPLYSWMAAPPDASKIPVLPNREFTYGNGISKPEHQNATLWIDQKLGENFDLQLSGYSYVSEQSAKDYEGAGNIYLDLNKQLPDGSANPNFGKQFADFFLSKQQQNRDVDEVRAQLNWNYNGDVFGIPVKQLFSASTGAQEIRWYARQYNAQVQGTGLTDPGQNLVWGRLYLDNPNATMDIPSSIGGKTVAYAPWPTPWFDFDETYKLKQVALASHTRLWDDKLSILGGIRHDNYDHSKLTRGSQTPVEDSANGTTYSAGAVYYFNWLGVFANYSKNFDPIGPGKQSSLSGTPFGPSTGEGLEYGLRVSTGDGKYYATVSRYDSKSHDRIFGGGKPDFAGMWRNYYDALGQTRDPARTTISYDDTEALKVSGYELDVVANPTKNLRLSFNYAKPESEIADALPGARAYYAANLATWQAGTTAAPGGSATAATDLRNQITSAANTLTQNLAGKTKTGLVDYTLSFFGNYTFDGEALKGFSAGAGFTYTGERYVGDFGAPDGQTKFPHYADAILTTNAVIAYETKFRRFPVRLQLNVDNVLDDRDPLITSYHWGWVYSPGHAVPNGYMLPAPRTFRLSARVTF